MKITDIVFALAYAAAASAAGAKYASSAPAPTVTVEAPQMPTTTLPVPVTPISIVIADFIYSPAPSVPAPAPTAIPAPLPVPSASEPPVIAPAPRPDPPPRYRTYTSSKRAVDASSIEGLVRGTSAMLFTADGSSYILARLPVNLAKKVSETPEILRKRATESDLITDATTNDLGENSVLYDLLGNIFARITLPVSVKIGISNPTSDGDSGELLRRDLLDDILGEVVASVVAPINVVANINPDEDGNGLLPNLLGRVSATVQVSPTITAHIFDSDKDDSGELLRRDLLDDILGEVVASVVAPINVVANINPDEDGNGLLPNLLGRVSLTVQASPTITAHIFDSDKDDSGELLRRDLLDNILGEVIASVVAPINVVANINPDEDGNGLLPNLLGRVSLTVQASPTITAHIFDSDNDDSGELLKREAVHAGVFMERLDGDRVAIYVPIEALAKSHSDVSQIASAGNDAMQVVSLAATPTQPASSAPTPAATNAAAERVFLRIVVPASQFA